MTKREALLEHPWALRRQKLGIAQHRLGGLSGTSEQAVMRAEQGIFSKPPVEILNILAEEGDFNTGLLIEEYYKYQQDTRELFARKYLDYYTAGGGIGYPNPLEHYREIIAISRIGLCKGWCVHPSSLFDYERGNQRAMPADIKRAFEVMQKINKGWDWRLLEEDIQKWRLHKND